MSNRRALKQLDMQTRMVLYNVLYCQYCVSPWFQLSTGGASTPAVCCRDQDGRGEAFWEDPLKRGVCNGCATVFRHFAWFCMVLHPVASRQGRPQALVQFQKILSQMIALAS